MHRTVHKAKDCGLVEKSDWSVGSASAGVAETGWVGDMSGRKVADVCGWTVADVGGWTVADVGGWTVADAGGSTT